MSVKKSMHPRNIYKKRPNFKQLAVDYPEFRKYAHQVNTILCNFYNIFMVAISIKAIPRLFSRFMEQLGIIKIFTNQPCLVETTTNVQFLVF